MLLKKVAEIVVDICVIILILNNVQAATESPPSSVMPRQWYHVQAAPQSSVSHQAGNADSLKVRNIYTGLC